MSLKLEILISAPNGCGDARVILDLLSKVDLSDKTVTILEYGTNCTNIVNPVLSSKKVKHLHFDELSEFDMRRHSFESSSARWLIYLEDHALPDDIFFSEINSYIDQKAPADAMTFYSKNGTPGSFGSRAIYNWVWGGAEVGLFPKKPEPVCSAFLVKRDAALLEIHKRNGVLRKGELEMQIIPTLIRNDQGSENRKVTIIHFEDVNMLTAMKAVASNGRISGHLEKHLLPRKGWLIHMLRRYFLRSFRIRRLNNFGFLDSIMLELMAISSFAGVVAGRYMGIGNAELDLAHAHPEVKS